MASNGHLKVHANKAILRRWCNFYRLGSKSFCSILGKKKKKNWLSITVFVRLYFFNRINYKLITSVADFLFIFRITSHSSYVSHKRAKHHAFQNTMHFKTTISCRTIKHNYILKGVLEINTIKHTWTYVSINIIFPSQDHQHCQKNWASI